MSEHDHSTESEVGVRDVPQDLDAVDLTRPETFVEYDLGQLWRRYRSERPVHWREGHDGQPGFWSLARHEDVQQAYRNPDLISGRGTVLDTLLAGGDSAGGRMLAVTDDPRHRQLRAVFQRSFSPRVISALSDRLQQRTDALVDQIAGVGEVDFAREVSDRLPMGTIGDLLGLPERDWPQLLEWNKRALSSDRMVDESPARARAARNEILFYFSDIVQHRRRAPGDDVISSLLAAQVQGEGLSDDDVILNCYSLIIGGDESSRVASIGAAKVLAEFDAEYRKLAAGQVDIRPVVEELLRWTTPAMHFARTAALDTRVGDVEVRAGDVVVLWNTSANSDPDAFDAPEQLRLDRWPNPHVALGLGPHFCIGAALGRLQLGCLVRSLSTRVSRIELGGTQQRIYSNFLFGYSSLTVSLHAA